jgi:hypothetical protein
MSPSPQDTDVSADDHMAGTHPSLPSSSPGIHARAPSEPLCRLAHPPPRRPTVPRGSLGPRRTLPYPTLFSSCPIPQPRSRALAVVP